MFLFGLRDHRVPPSEWYLDNPFLGSRSPFCELAAETLQLCDPRFQSLLARGVLLLGEGRFASCLLLPAPSEQYTLGQGVLPADLWAGAFLAGCDLSTALKFELLGVLPPQTLLFDPDVTLHPIHGEVDFGSGPVEWVHPTLSR
jgi:hypothetical protein